MEASLTRSIQDTIDKTYTTEEVMSMNPLTLAFIGDSFFSNAIRLYLIGCGHQNVNYMTKISTRYVKANAQASIIHEVMDQLSEEEIRIVKRGRNTHSHVPKNAKPSDYRYATGFEALVGYLYLLGESRRLDWLITSGIAHINNLYQK